MRLPLLAIVFGGVAALATAQPVIRASQGVLNASGYQSLLAPDTVFVIFGSGLGPAAIQEATAPNYPQSLSETSVSFAPASGGTAIAANMVYTLATQIAGVLPSSITPGAYNVTVTYEGTKSNAVSVTVVARSLGIATSNSGGTGQAQATIGNVNGGLSLDRMTGGASGEFVLSPAHPGDEVVLWGTGGGADSKNDTGGSSGDQTTAGNFTVNVDGTSIVPLYSGTSSGYPGLWQVNFVLPSNIAADCLAGVTVTGGGQTSNDVTLAIAATGQTSCSSGIPASTLSLLDSGTGTVTMAGLGLGEYIVNGTPSYTAGGVVNQYTVPAFLIDYSGPKVGACTYLGETYPTTSPEPSAPSALLDAGSSMTLTGPGGLNMTVPNAENNAYNASLSSIIPGGSYTLKATGGSQVGPFTATATFPNSFTVTNLSSLTSVNRSQPLTINWTGSGFDTVDILINATTESTTTVSGSVLDCLVPSSPGTYTIPAAALSLLAATPSAQFEVVAETTLGYPGSAESTMEPNTVVPLASGALVNFGGFGTAIGYIQTGVPVK